MSNKIKIVSSCRMGPGTFEAKFIPLCKVDIVEEIIVVRKEKGPYIPKLKYVVLPKICASPFINFIIASYNVGKLARKYNANFILAYHYVPHYYIAFVASLLSSKPYILGQTGRDDELLAKHPIKGILLRHIVKKAYQLNVPGSVSFSFWKSLGIDRVYILHSTIDTDKFLPDNSEKVYDFLYVGRLEEYKGVQYIIQAFCNVVKEYPNATLCIVGYGSYENELRKMIKNFNLSNNVIFFRFQSDPYPFYCKSKIFVMASETEGLPCALMEAMSCELLCISSSVGNIEDVLKDGINGLTFSSGNISKLKELMILALENYDDLIEVRANARKLIVNEYSYKVATDKWNKIISGMLQ
jgi:glycosyltransferase involved in cell wall biosynthesis